MASGLRLRYHGKSDIAIPLMTKGVCGRGECAQGGRRRRRHHGAGARAGLCARRPLRLAVLPHRGDAGEGTRRRARPIWGRWCDTGFSRPRTCRRRSPASRPRRRWCRRAPERASSSRPSLKTSTPNAPCSPSSTPPVLDGAIFTSTTSYLDTFQAVPERRLPTTVIAHWFAPPHIVPLVEVVRGERTSDETVSVVVGSAGASRQGAGGHGPVRARLLRQSTAAQHRA